MRIKELVDSEGKLIKHLKPSKYRKLKRLLRDFCIYIIESKIITVHLHYYDGEELWADIYEHKLYKKGGTKFLETVHTFQG